MISDSCDGFTIKKALKPDVKLLLRIPVKDFADACVERLEKK